MEKATKDVFGLRYTGRAALDRNPLEDRVEFVCPDCGAPGDKAARRPLAAYHFTDGFVQDLQGESAICRKCKHSIRVAPVVLLHDRDEKRRFEAAYDFELGIASN
jgi:hypothetical protein